MYQKFKIGATVQVVGMGKEEPIRLYKYRFGRVLERDSFYLDYKIQFKNGSTDWFDAKCLRHPKRLKRRRDKK